MESHFRTSSAPNHKRGNTWNPSRHTREPHAGQDPRAASYAGCLGGPLDGCIDGFAWGAELGLAIFGLFRLQNG